jgi:hypothetical protein
VQRGPNFGLAWLLLCVAFSLHTWDEWAHDFLGYFNATVLTLYGHFSWFPRMDMEFRTWMTLLVLANLLCLGFTPFAFCNAWWLRPIGYLFAGIQFVNGLGHVAVTIRGGTVGSVRFEGVAPGFYTAPLLLVSSVFLFWSLRKSSDTDKDLTSEPE